MAGKNTLIMAADYNVIQSKIAQILGVGLDDYGYSQVVSSRSVVELTSVTATHWTNLRTDILKARQHQTGANETGNLSLANNTTLITNSTFSQYQDMIDIIDINRLVTPPANQSTRDNMAIETHTAPWNTQISHTATINFVDAETARKFFNTGSSIDISATRSGGATGSKNSSWTTMLANMGIISFRRDSSNITGTGTVSQDIGWSNLTTTDQLLFQKLTETPTYSPNQYDIYVRRGITVAQIVFSIYFKDLSGQPNQPWGIDELVDGTLTSLIQAYRASGTNVSVSTPVAVSVIT